MSKLLTFTVIVVFSLAFYVGIDFSDILVNAQTSTPTQTPTPTPDDKSEKLNELQGKIAELESKINELQDKEKSLSSEIKVMDGQIQLTELRVDATKQEIADLGGDIDIANTKISSLEKSLDEITKVLLNRVVATYQIGSIEPLQILLSSDDVDNFLQRANYLRIAQANDKKLMYNTVQARNDYENQKEIYEAKKDKVESLRQQLEEYTAQIEGEKKSRQDLLSLTKNDEKKYQELLAAARAERSAIEGVVSTFKLENGTPVTKGQTIAVVGNSGAPYCSTGPHLHFTIRKNGAVDNPSNYLRSGVNFNYSYDSNQYDYYGTISPGGDWDWPLSEPIRINQGYGSHGYARSFYPNGIHDGIDMDSSSSSLIKAPKDGTLYKGSTSCGGATMNFVAVEHGDGVVSWYWHVK